MNTITTCSHKPWNKGKLVGQKAPLRVRDFWATRVRLQLAAKTRDLAHFNLKNGSGFIFRKNKSAPNPPPFHSLFIPFSFGPLFILDLTWLNGCFRLWIQPVDKIDWLNPQLFSACHYEPESILNYRSLT